MTSRDFCYWLQGYFELTGEGSPEPMSADKIGMIKRHLALVFKHEIDPSIAKPGTPEAKALDAIHGSGKRPKTPEPTYCAPPPEEPNWPGSDTLIRC